MSVTLSKLKLPLLDTPLPPWAAMSVALAAVAASAVLRIVLTGVVSDSPLFLLYIPAVFTAAAFGGFQAGLIATCAAMVAEAWLFGLYQQFTANAGLRLALFGLEGLFIVWLAGLLRESRRRFAQVVDAVGEIFYLHMPSEGRFLYVSPAYERIWGRPSAELRKDAGRWLAAVHPDDRAQVEAAMARPTRRDLEYRIVRPDGELRWVRDRAYPVDNAEGSLQAGIVADISERVRSEERLNAQAETLGRQAAAIEASHEAILLREAGGRILTWNRGAEEVYGWTVAEAVGQRSHALFATEVLTGGDIETELARHRRWNGELLHRRKDGTRIFVESRQFLAPSFGVLEINRDITDRRRAEEELRALNENLEQRVRERTRQLEEVIGELEAFSYHVAHDLRAPLRSMRGFAQVLIEDCGEALDGECLEYLGRIDRAGMRMERLVEDLLAYSRLGRTNLTLQPVELAPVVAEAIATNEAEIREKKAEVHTESPLPPVVAHRPILVQILANLISNAVKFSTPGGPPRVRLYADPGAAPGTVRLVVEDNGIGIAPENLERIWGVFERLHNYEAYPGTGIGLAIVRRAAERMGGRAGVTSQPGRGSRFWVELQEVRQ